jgi:hypothetical protein
MDSPGFFTTPTGIAVIAAGGSFIAGLVGAGISSWTIRATHRQRVAVDEKLAERKFNFDKDLAERKFAFDTKLAEQKLKHDRELHDHKRRVELAEELVAEFRQSRDVIKAIRSPMAYPDEGAGRPRHDNEEESEARQRDSYYVPLVRLKNNSAFLNGLLSKRYRAQALFGAEIDQAFRSVLEVMVSVQTAAQMLIGMAGPRHGRDEFWERCEGDIWGGFREDDPLTRKMDEAIAAIEAIGRPILQARQ